MFHEKIKALFSSAVVQVVSTIALYVINPDRDLIRRRKIPPEQLITFLVSEGSSTTKNELLDFFGMDVLKPTDSAFNQQRAKLKHEALEAVFHQFNSSVASLSPSSGYHYIAADGSTFTFFSKPHFTPEEYYVSQGHSAKGFYSMHLNAFYDLDKHTYIDALLQPVHHKDEFLAFREMVDRYEPPLGRAGIFVGDRGYCSYNNMACVINNGQFFLFRTKDIHSKGLVRHFDFPDQAAFDLPVDVSLVRNNSTKMLPTKGYRRFIDKATSFDFLEYGSMDAYELSFRVVRFPLSDSSFECIVTNLPADEFPPQRIKEIYYSRWGIESSFRKLKYTIGLSNFHTYKPEFIKQEIWAKLIAYNLTQTLINHTKPAQKETIYEYKINFSVAAHICRAFLRPATEKGSINVMSLLQQELIPIRNERQYKRLTTAHFRRPRYFLYRAA
jgi:hypothetical protein